MVVFLGDRHYGSIGCVTATATLGLSIKIEEENHGTWDDERFKAVATHQAQLTCYTPSYKVANLLHMMPKALLKITSAFLVAAPDGTKVNIGLVMKFDAKSLKVIEYTRKPGRHWEYSQKAIDLIRAYKLTFPELFESLEYEGDKILKASELFKSADPQSRLQEITTWLAVNGVNELECVPLLCDQLPKANIAELERIGHQIVTRVSPSGNRREIIYEGLSTQAVLSPQYATTRLKDQVFSLGDCVKMVQASGSIPFSMKGVVVGLDGVSIDVLWDEPFMLGTTLGGRCSSPRGMTVECTSCLNLTHPQHVTKLVGDTSVPTSYFPHESSMQPGRNSHDGSKIHETSTVRIMEDNIGNETGWNTVNQRTRGRGGPSGHQTPVAGRGRGRGRGRGFGIRGPGRGGGM